MIKIALVITNYNGLRYLAEYLDDMAKVCQDNNITLIVTDNGSTDGSIEYLQQGNHMYTVNPKKNQGYASNLNNGIRYAMSLDAFDYMILSNNDIVVNGEMFEPLQRVLQILMEKFPQHGLIGFDEVLKDRKQHFDSFDYDSYSPESVVAVTEMIGFFFFAIPVRVIKQVGFFDEEYFIYGEDNDYFTRISRSGFTCYDTRLPVMHYSEGSSTNSKSTSWYVYRNAFLFAQKNLSFYSGFRIFLSFVNQIYNPFYKTQNPSHSRVRRNGFFYNNYLLAKSLWWNMKYYIKKNG